MQKSTVFTLAAALALLASMVLSSCVSCERCARNRAAKAAEIMPAGATATEQPTAATAW